MMTAIALALAGPGAAVAAPSSTPSAFPVVDGRVNALLVDGDTAYIGGRFQWIARQTGPLVFFSPTDGRLQRGFTEITVRAGDEGHIGPSISAVEPDGEGGWYAGGGFDRAGDEARLGLLRMRPDGSVDARFRPEVTGNVAQLALHGDILWVAGSLYRVNGEDEGEFIAMGDQPRGRAALR